MKVLKLGLLSCLIFPVCVLGNDGLRSQKPLLNPLYREYMESSLHLKLYQGFGFRNVSWDMDLCYQFRQYFSIGIGNGFHLNSYPIFSSSDKHKLRMWSYPLYLKGNIYLFGNSNRACYIYGKYGRSFGLKTKAVDPSDSFKAITAEGGVGYELMKGNRSIYFELGQYYVSADGVFESTYNSVINYKLQIYSIVGRIGFKIKFV